MRLTDVIGDSARDAFEDILSDEVKVAMKEQFAPLREEYAISKEEKSVTKRFIAQTLENLESALSHYVIFKITDYLERTVGWFVLQFSYINRNRLSQSLPAFARRGRLGSMLSGMLKKDEQNDILKCQSVGSSIDTLNQISAHERATSQKIIIDEKNTKMRAYEIGQRAEIDMFHHLTTTGSWTTSAAHKKLYRSVMNDKKISFTQKEVDFINEHSNFFKTATGKVYNTSEAIIQSMIANNQLR